MLHRNFENLKKLVEEKVICNNCDWQGREDELKMFFEDGEHFKGCPNCETDDYLMDLTED